MATEVKIPVPDQTTEEVRIVKWLKAEGDPVNKGDIVLEVETDKSVMEVEAVGSGTLLKRLYAEDDMVAVGKVVGLIGEEGADIAVPAVPTKAALASVASTAAAPAEKKADIKASPVALIQADKLGIDISQVTGTGPKGKIVRADVEAFAQDASGTAITDDAVVASGTAAAGGRIFASPNARRLAKDKGVDLSRVKGTGPGGRIVGLDVEKTAKSGLAAAPAAAKPAAMPPTAAAKVQPKAGTEVPLTKMRRAIGLNLQKSFRDTPHFNVTMSIDMTRAMQVREKLNASRPKEQRISVNDLVVRAAALGLTQFTTVNSRLLENSIVYHNEINIGVATAIDEGLVVPVLTSADQRSWDDLAKETKRLAQEARSGKIIGAGKGTFTVSNLGMYGVEEFTGVINPPESAILTVGAVRNEVVAIAGGIGIKPMMKATLCSDHRVIDGATAAQFLGFIKHFLEEEICE